jgi:hypothetical protein
MSRIDTIIPPDYSFERLKYLIASNHCNLGGKPNELTESKHLYTDVKFGTSVVCGKDDGKPCVRKLLEGNYLGALQEVLCMVAINQFTRQKHGCPSNYVDLMYVHIDHHKRIVSATMESLLDAKQYGYCYDQLTSEQHKLVLQQVFYSGLEAFFAVGLVHGDVHDRNLFIRKIAPTTLWYDINGQRVELRNVECLVIAIDNGLSDVVVKFNGERVRFCGAPLPGGTSGPCTDILRLLNTVYLHSRSDTVRQVCEQFWTEIVTVHGRESNHGVPTLHDMFTVIEDAKASKSLSYEMIYRSDVADTVTASWTVDDFHFKPAAVVQSCSSSITSNK